jgi:hypothetical protein
MILFPDFEDFIKFLNGHSVDYMFVAGMRWYFTENKETREIYIFGLKF